MRLDPNARITREAFDAVAEDYARLLPDMTGEAPLDRGVLAAFVELVRACGAGRVADIGCGTGRLTAHLADAQLGVVGLDLSCAMVAVARAARPDLSFAVAHAGALPLRSRALRAVVAWYSLINLQPELMPTVLAEFARVTRPGAPLLLAFQSGAGERVDRATAYGHPVPITYFRHRVEDVTDAAIRAGFDLHTTVRRQPALPHETTPQAFVLAQRRPD